MNFPSPDMGRRMGRPSMSLEETKVRLNAGSKRRIITLVGEQRMATFIREAVEEKLRAEEAAHAQRTRTKPKADPDA